MKRKIIVMLIVCVLLVNSSAYAYSSNETMTLSAMEAGDIIDYLATQNVTIPPELEDYSGLEEFVISTVKAVEDNPNIVFCYNYYPTLELAENIKSAVNAYYNDVGIDLYSEKGTYTLQYSKPVGEWSNLYLQYNCYAYALEYRFSPISDSFFPYPGFFSDSSSFSINGTVEQWAALTSSDLNEKGYACIYMTTSYDDLMQHTDECKIICLRKSNEPDFHYMALNGNSWYHKPGNTHVLQYLGSKPDDTDWIREYSFCGIDYLDTEKPSYTGTIYYFAYKDGHNFTSREYTSEQYHDGNYHYFQYLDYCADCQRHYYGWEKVPCSGPPCQVSIMQITPETHCE